MTQFNFTGVVLTVTPSIGGQQTWELVVDEFYPLLTVDATKPDIHYTNDDFNVSVTIQVEISIGKPPCRFGELLTEAQADAMSDTDRYIYSGYLRSWGDPCALCDDQRHITVRVGMTPGGVNVIFATTPEEISDALDAMEQGTQDIALPCPGCRIPEYLLAKDEHLREGDSR